MLNERIDADLREARRRRDPTALRTLGVLKTEVVRAQKEKGGDAGDEAVLRIVRREVKRREEAASAFEQARRSESAAEELAEAEVLRGYLPAELGDEQLEDLVRAVVQDLGASSPRDMGPVMKEASARVQGRAEAGRVAGVARRLLAG